MAKIVLISDEHIVEGVLGSLKFLIIAFILTKFVKLDSYLVGPLAFLITFYFRKTFVNIYKHLKKEKIFSIKPWSIHI
jgi:hypothetical protein